MIIETVIPCILLGALIGFFVGKDYAEELFKVKACGWNISAVKALNEEKYYVYAKQGDKKVIVILKKDGFDFIHVDKGDETR